MNTKISLYEHVRKLRFMRVTGQSASEMKRYAENLRHNLGVDPDKILAAAALPGDVGGYPYLAKADDDHQARKAKTIAS